MFAIKNTLVSDELLQRKFVCNLQACKGACCVEGDGGAPLTKEEIQIIEENLPQIRPFMRPEGIAAVNAFGVAYEDQEFEPATTLVEGKECAFVYIR